eukprot:1349992-Pyramimonas_sp.AAC.1
MRKSAAEQHDLLLNNTTPKAQRTYGKFASCQALALVSDTAGIVQPWPFPKRQIVQHRPILGRQRRS